MAHIYNGAEAAILTRHGKEKILGPVLEAGLGVQLAHTDGYDTDRLGTFSGEVPRTLSPLACARKKAELACEMTGTDVGLGSEGSYGGGPFGALIPWNTEIIVWYDRARDWQIVASAAGPTSAAKETFPDAETLLEFASGVEAGQGVILRSGQSLVKGIADACALKRVLEELPVSDRAGPYTLEFDLRAHHSPERRKRIGEAAENLVNRLLSLCPDCARPGFWFDQAIFGLPCQACGYPTERVGCRVARCESCGREQQQVLAESADPLYCSCCNP
jgi:hypothetical protein